MAKSQKLGQEKDQTSQSTLQQLQQTSYPSYLTGSTQAQLNDNQNEVSEATQANPSTNFKTQLMKRVSNLGVPQTQVQQQQPGQQTSKSKYDLKRASLIQQKFQHQKRLSTDSNRLSLIPPPFQDFSNKLQNQKEMKQQPTFSDRLSYLPPPTFQGLQGFKQQVVSDQNTVPEETERFENDHDITFCHDGVRSSTQRSRSSLLLSDIRKSQETMFTQNELYSLIHDSPFFKDAKSIETLQNYLTQLSRTTQINLDHLDQIAALVTSSTVPIKSQLIDQMKQRLSEFREDDKYLMEGPTQLFSELNLIDEQDLTQIQAFDDQTQVFDEQLQSIVKWTLLGQEASMHTQELMLASLQVDQQIKVAELQLKTLQEQAEKRDQEIQSLIDQEMKELRLHQQLHILTIQQLDQQHLQIDIDLTAIAYANFNTRNDPLYIRVVVGTNHAGQVQVLKITDPSQMLPETILKLIDKEVGKHYSSLTAFIDKLINKILGYSLKSNA